MTKKKKPKQYRVPMTWEMRGHALVEATSEDEAHEMCNKLNCELEMAQAEIFDWGVVGDPEEIK